jgi:RHS repeat-associated protein
VQQVTGSQVTSYLWDETSLYGDVVYETTGSVNTSYVLAGSKLISQSRNGSTSFYLQDGQDSTRTLTDDSGNVTDTYSYTAFGEIFSQSGTTENKYLYTGQQFDSLTGLYSLRARYFNPAVGRFLSQDSYAVNYNNPVELNRYVYAANRAVNASDPSGQMLIETALNALSAFGRAMNTSAPLRAFVGGSFGAIGGALSASLCGGDPLFGALGGFVVGTATAYFLPFQVTAGIGLATGVAGWSSAWRDIALNGVNACNFFQLTTSVLGAAGGLMGVGNFLGGFGGGSGLQPVFAGGSWASSGATQAIVPSIVGWISPAISLSSVSGLANMMSGGDSEQGNNTNGTGESSTGYLPEETANQIQKTVDKVKKPLYVVGGAAQKFNWDDIDYAADFPDAWQDYFDAWNDGSLPTSNPNRLPSSKIHPPFPVGNGYQPLQVENGVIIFRPNQPPIYYPPK